MALTVTTELTRLVPGVASAFIKFANSGSDLFIEGRLISVIGRVVIPNHVRIPFEEAVANSKWRNITLWVPDIVLETTGQMLLYALRDPSHLAVVIQLSLLTYAHECKSLAQILSPILHRDPYQAEEQANTQDVYFVDANRLNKVFEAWKQQTARFSWHDHFDRVETKLGILYRQAYQHSSTRRSAPNSALLESRVLPNSILPRLIQFLPEVQNFPQDRQISIVATQGVATVVVWAYYVLDLTVHVTVNSRSWTQEVIKFGEGRPQVLINVDCHSGNEVGKICLLNASNEDIRIYPPEEVYPNIFGLKSNLRWPLRGYGVSIITSQLMDEANNGENPVLTETDQTRFALLTLAFSIQLFGRWTSDKNGQLLISINEDHFENHLRETPFQSWSRIQSALTTLFPESSKIKRQDVYAQLQRLISRQGGREFEIKKWTCNVKYQVAHKKCCLVELAGLAGLIAALSCVQDVTTCQELMVPVFVGKKYPQRQATTTYLKRGSVDQWEPWLLIAFFAQVLTGEVHQTEEIERTYVISHDGWSAYLPIDGYFETSNRNPYQIGLAPGVPTRLGLRKSKVVATGASTTVPSNDAKAMMIPPDFDLTRDLSKTSQPKTFVGIGEDSFLVNLVLTSLWGSRITGHAELYQVFLEQKILGCPCPPSDDGQQISVLQQYTYLYQGLKKSELSGHRRELHLIPVAGNRCAQALCLLAAKDGIGPTPTRCWFRASGCCLTHFFQQLEVQSADPDDRVAHWVFL